MSGRQAIPKRLRYAVLERDGYRCRYCGAEAADAKLHVDHRMPVAKGGTNDFDNLVTACADCNLGKHAFLPIKTIYNQRGAAFASIIFGRACERFGAAALTWSTFCVIQDLCYSETRPEDLLEIILGEETIETAIAAMLRYAGYPDPDEYWGDGT